MLADGGLIEAPFPFLSLSVSLAWRSLQRNSVSLISLSCLSVFVRGIVDDSRESPGK
jgi:hypothetical protein